MKNFFTSSIIFIFCFSCELKTPEKESFEFKILNELRISHIRESINRTCSLNCDTIVLRISNFSHENILMYNFNRHTSFMEFNYEDCDSIGGVAEKLLFIYDENGNQILPEISVDDSLHLIDTEKLIHRIDMESLWFKNTKMIFPAGTSIEIKELVNFRKAHLISPGEYWIRLLYTQGDVSNYVSNEQLMDDCRLYSANLYQGCLWSNKVKLIVE